VERAGRIWALPEGTLLGARVCRGRHLMHDALRAKVALACRILAREGHGHLCFGHVSARAGDAMAIKVAGLGLEEVVEADVAIYRWDGTTDPPEARMHDELPLHAQLYRADPSIGAVIHTHPPNAVLVSHDPSILADVSQDSAAVGATVTFSDDPLMLTTDAAARRLAGVLGGHRAALLRGHGLVATGVDVEEATVLAVLVERACAACVDARAARIQPRPDPESALALSEMLAANYDKRTAAIWAYLARADRAELGSR
jgi:L-fuculose-phosphate aldolase